MPILTKNLFISGSKNDTNTDKPEKSNDIEKTIDEAKEIWSQPVQQAVEKSRYFNDIIMIYFYD